MALDLNADPTIDPNAYNFQASAPTNEVASGPQNNQPQATQTFGAAALDPKLQQQLSQVLRPEEHGQRGIQVDPQLADDIERIGADVSMTQGSPGILGDIVGAAKSLGADMMDAKASLTANQPAPVVAEVQQEVQQTWTPPPQALTV